jgi:peptidoglycan/xylan/chitin deacetylase (PgdA/CDA1 family)
MGDRSLRDPARADRFNFPGTFFPQTLVLGAEGFLSEDQLRDLDRAGMTIGAHTFDHQRVDRLAGDQWRVQLDQPRAQLAGILGHPVDLLAYPYGVWSQEALERVAAAGYRAAFQLGDAPDPAQPLLTIRRIMPSSSWDGPTLLAHLESAF